MSIFRHAAIVGFFTGMSRLLGFVREIIMARYFGIGLAKSAFEIAFRIPNLFRRLFGEGALSAAFVPVFAEALEKDGRQKANQLAGRALGLLATFLTLVTGAGMMAAALAMRYAPDNGRLAAVLPLLIIMLPYMVLICIVALCMGILNAVGHFVVSAASPVLLNVVWIAAVVWVCPRLGDTQDERIVGVAWAVLLAGILQLVSQLPIMRRLRVLPRISFTWRDPHIRTILWRLGPAAVGMGVHQINVIVDGVLALWAGDWAPAALSYAERLIYLPLGIFATALGTVLLPAFAKQAAANRESEIPATLARSLNGLMLIMTPAAAGLMVLATPITRLAYETGEFDAEATTLTARALVAYAPGLVVFSLYKMLTPAFYAIKDTRTPVRIGLLSVAINLVLNVILVVTLPTYYKHAGLAFATVVASGVNGAILAVILTRRIGSPGWRKLASTFARVILCTAVMALAIRTTEHWITPLARFTTATKTGQGMSLVALMLSGTIAYAAAVLLFCRGEIRGLRRSR